MDPMKERAETGRIYIMNIDHCNSHSSSPLLFICPTCVRRLLSPPPTHIDDENGEISLCILSAINVGKIRNLEELKPLCDIAVRGLDALIDYKVILSVCRTCH